MFPKYYNYRTLSTPLPTQKIGTCQISSVKTKSIWQTSLLKLKNYFWKVQVKWINYRVKPTPNIPQTPKLPSWGHDFLLKNFEWWRVSTDWALVSENIFWRSPKMKYIVSLEGLEKFSWKICTENRWKSVKILTDLQLSLRSSGTIFTDPQGKLAHRSVQILKESSTWVMILCKVINMTWVVANDLWATCGFFSYLPFGRETVFMLLWLLIISSKITEH